MTNCIVIDWLQLRVGMPCKEFDTAIKSDLFYVVRREHGSQQFNALYDIYEKETDEEVAVIAAEPRNEMALKFDDAIVKILNKHLYQKNLKGFTDFFLKELNLTFRNIVRIDVTMDFLHFDTMYCEDFLYGFLDRKFLKKHCAKFAAHGTTWSVDKGQMTNGTESLKFGKASSDVTYQLYNKTLQMCQVEHKPWIAQNWEDHGHNGVDTVWRLEFSLKSDTRGIVLDDGEVLFFNNLDMIDRVVDLWTHCYEKYFQFVHTEKTKKGNYKKQSRCQPVRLFLFLYMEPLIMKTDKRKDSGRSAKVLTKGLYKLSQELRGQDFDMAIVGNEFMTYIIKSRNLEAWAKKKLPDIYFSERIEGIIQNGRNSALDIAVMEARQAGTDAKLSKKQPKKYRDDGVLWEDAPF